MSEIEGLFVVVYDGDSIEGPMNYENAVFIWQWYIESGYTARIAKLSFLD